MNFKTIFTCSLIAFYHFTTLACDNSDYEQFVDIEAHVGPVTYCCLHENRADYLAFFLKKINKKRIALDSSAKTKQIIVDEKYNELELYLNLAMRVALRHDRHLHTARLKTGYDESDNRYCKQVVSCCEAGFDKIEPIILKAFSARLKCVKTENKVFVVVEQLKGMQAKSCDKLHID